MTENQLKKKFETDAKLRAKLFKRINRRLPQLQKLLEESETHPWGIEDGIYRFYHGSFKVYMLQEFTLKMLDEFRNLLPGQELNSQFIQIINDGTFKEFKVHHNRAWLKHTRPIIEAFFHAQYLLKMICKYASEFERSSGMVESGILAVLYLYRLR